MSKRIDFITDSKKRFTGTLLENNIAFEIQCNDLPIPEDGERVYFKVGEKAWSFIIAETNIRGDKFVVYLRRDSGKVADMDPFSDENLDLDAELDQ